MFTALLLAGSLVPLATMLGCLFAAAWIREGRKAQETVSATRLQRSRAASARAPR
ncbi:MAG TPA: hypothetical protein VHD91_07175 [Gaiellaceae bacterium]|nr:hypothetical protein [Gaiellaceae bacterium]